MEQKKTKVVIEDNTLYEIDLECLRIKKEKENALENSTKNNVWDRRRVQNNQIHKGK